jgi:opacity protein-like surface antigen
MKALLLASLVSFVVLPVMTGNSQVAYGSSVTTPVVASTPPLNPPPPQTSVYFERAYVHVDLGGVLMHDTTIKNLGLGGFKASFNPGVRGDVSIGYNFIPQLAAEFETGTIWNSLDSRSRRVVFPGTDEADLFQVPFLANLVFRIPCHNGFIPYIGGGIGGVASTFALHADNAGFHAHANDTEFTFAYEGMAGVKYAFASNMEVDVGYKFLGTLEQTWFNNNPNLITRADPLYSHSFLVSFAYRF